MRAPLILAVIALALAGQPALAQTPPVSSPPPPLEGVATLDDVEVTGGQLEALAREFVDSLAAPARGRGLARWESDVCLGVVNFRNNAAVQLINHISDVASDVGVGLGGPGCNPNVLIIGTSDGKALAAELVNRHRSQFRYGYTQSNRGSRALEVFQTSQVPVRWWHISLPYNTETGEVAIRLPGRGAVPWPCPVNRGRRFCDQVTDRLMRSVIIVDIVSLPEVSFVQLADYLSVLALAQVEPETDFSTFDTVLNVMEHPDRTRGMTSWDLNYLRALYSGQSQRIDADEQAASLVDLMREPAEEQGPP